MQNIKKLFFEALVSFKQLSLKRRIIYTSIAAILICYVIYDDTKNNKPDREPTVVTATAKVANVPVYMTAIGNVTSEYTVTVNAQVNGRLTKILFKEGQKVKAGDILAQIDSAPYVAQLEQAQGQLDRDTSFLENAKLDLARDEALWKQHAISKQAIDTQTALVNQYKGAVELDQGMADNAKTNLAYCDITSPIDGIIGLRQIDTGNIIEVASNPLIATLHSIDPINVTFTIPQNALAPVWVEFNKNPQLVAIVYDKDPNNPIVTGKLVAIDNQIDPTTGTVKLKAQFKNDTNVLFPNQFVNIKLMLNTLQGVIVVPVAAVQQGQKSKFVYVINQDHKVKAVDVECGPADGQNIVITKGLSKDDLVVTEGTDRLADNTKVSIAPSKQ